MRIPLPKMMRHWREQEFERHLTPRPARLALKLWAFFARRPALYHFGAGLKMPILAACAGRKGRLRALPLAGAWTRTRDFPAPQGRTFQSLWAARGRGGRA
jgi:L-lactate dehydrogenase complex protein LldF